MKILRKSPGTLAVVLALGLSCAANALPLATGGATPFKPKVSNPLRDLTIPVYMYAQQPRSEVNWMYIGLAPRMNDSSRVQVIISKRGLTMRVIMSLTPEDVAAYPNQLVSRYEKLTKIIAENQIQILQTHRFTDYERKIRDIMNDLCKVGESKQKRYEYGYSLLKTYYPKNIFELVGKDGQVAQVEADFVYPITIHVAKEWPPPGVYSPYYFDERRSHYRGGGDLFGGFPAFWLDPRGDGTGVHGPIVFSNAPYAGKGKRENIQNFWQENNFLNETIDPVSDIKPTYRWDLLRTNASHGCFRAESLELRHLLPANPESIIETSKHDGDPDKVVFTVLDDFDRISIPGRFTSRIVNVDYYVLSAYQKVNKEGWQRTVYGPLIGMHAKDTVDRLQSFMNENVQTFPYLDPGALEFRARGGSASYKVMSLMNQAD